MINLKSKSNNRTNFPLLGYAGYFVSKFFDSFKPLSFLLDRLETMSLKDDIDNIKIDSPIYITGLARAGTTIVLEMLSKHPDLASHRYKHLLVPYIPHWISQIVKKTKIYSTPFERFHNDGIMVTRESPEAVEEIFWQKFFKNIHNENISNVINFNVSNPKFKYFYANHIRKLMINQKSSRYLAKNNYNVARMEYLLQLFPSSKILLIIRNPVDHIASLIKQTKHFRKIEQEIPLLKKWLRILGHYEFGQCRICINLDNSDHIRKIREFWKNKKTYVKGWAYYWHSIYDYVANHLEANKKLKEVTLIVKYDDLCETPAKIIDKILEHTELPTREFEEFKSYYVKYLHKPTYYTPDFSKQDLAYISEVTKETASRFGY